MIDGNPGLLSRRVPGHQGQPFSHRAMGFQVMPEGFASIDAVAIATALLGDGQITTVLQITNNFLHGTLGDPDVRGHVALAGRLLTKPQCMGE